MASEESKVPVENKEVEAQQNDTNKTPVKAEEETKAADPVVEQPTQQPPKPLVHKANFEKDIVYLYQFSRTPVLPSISPYCLKVETWLRLTGLKYEVSLLNCSWPF